MPFQRATLTGLRDDVLEDTGSAQIYDTKTGQLVDVLMLGSSPLRCVGYSTAGATYSAYGYLDWIALQAVPWTAQDEFAVGWGALKGVTRKAATAASDTETITGTVADTDIPSGTGVTRSDGTAYVTTADATISSSLVASITFAAVVAGAAGNLDAGATLTFTNPIAGVESSFITANAITGGADIETMDAFKARYLQVYASPPAGGDQTDYEEWALAVPGVTRAWCNPNGNGAGTVVTYTMWDVANAAWGGFPQGSNGVATNEPRDDAAQGDQLTVANYIYPLRPVTALVYSCAPIAQPVAFVLANLGTAPSAALLASIDAALDAMFLRIGSPLGVTLYPNQWEAALATVAGLTQYTLVSPVAPITCAVGYLANRGAVTATA